MQKGLCRSTIAALLKRTSIPMPTFDATVYGEDVGNVARAEVQTWNAGDVPPQRIERGLVAGIDVARMAYGHTPLATQVHIALWTALCIYVDDFDIGVGEIAEFPARFHSGRAQLHPLLDVLADKLRKMPDFFHDYGAAAIVTSTIQFITCTLVDKQTEGARRASIRCTSGLAIVSAKRMPSAPGIRSTSRMCLLISRPPRM